MAFTQEEYNYERYKEFHYYFAGKEHGFETQSIAPGVLWKLKEVRLHFSDTFASTEDMVVRISSINGSAFNQVLVSQTMSDVKSYRVVFDGSGVLLYSDDQVVITGSMVSNVISYGLEAIGWAVRG